MPASAIEGSEVPGAPTWSLAVGGDHRIALNSAIDVVTRLDVERRGRTYWTLDKLDQQDIDTRVDASVSLEHDRWALRLFADNLFDEEYIEWFFGARFIGLPADIAWPSAPRRVGLEFSYPY